MKTLAVQEMKESLTAVKIKETVLEILDQFGVNIQQIYSCTTDNGGNFIKAVELLSDESVNDDTDDSDDEDKDLANVVSLEGEVAVIDWTIPDVTDTDIESSEQQQEKDVFSGVEIGGIKFIPCVAHTLQLAVKDFVKDREVASVIATAKDLARKLRTPTFRYLISAKGHNLPRLDNETRWSSTFLLIQSLLSLQEICKELESEGKIKAARGGSKRWWEKLIAISEALTPAFKATKYFQREQLTAGKKRTNLSIL